MFTQNQFFLLKELVVYPKNYYTYRKNYCLIAKLIIHGENRSHCILRLKQALKEIIIAPISTTIDLHKKILETKVMEDGSYDIRWLEEEFLS